MPTATATATATARFSLLFFLLLLTASSSSSSVLISGGAGFLGQHFASHFCSIKQPTSYVVTIVDPALKDTSLTSFLLASLNCSHTSLRLVPYDCRTFFLEEEGYQHWDFFFHFASVTRPQADGAHEEGHLASSLQLTESLAIDAAAFHWVADASLRSKGLTIGKVVYVGRSPSFFSDMLLSHAKNGIKASVFITEAVYGHGQLKTSGVFSSLFHQVTSYAASGVGKIHLPADTCDDYMYVGDVVQSVYAALTTVSEGDGTSPIFLKSGVLTRDLDILNELNRVYAVSPDVVMGDGAVLPCAVTADVSTPHTTSLPGFLHPTISIREGIARMVSHQALQRETRSATDIQLEKKKFKYSTVRCTAGHQDLPIDWAYYSDDYNSVTNRVCMFEDICLVDNRLVYYQHPTEVAAPPHARFPPDKIFVFLSLTGLLDMKIDFVPSPLPHEVSYVDENTWLFTLASYSFNFAHVLLDELFSALGAMDMFNIPYREGRLLYHGCSSHHDKVNLYEENPHAHPYDFKKSSARTCEANMKLYSRLVFGHEATELNQMNKESVCFKRFIVGQGYVLSSGTVDKQRPVTLRKGRDAMLTNLQLNHLSPPRRLSIMVLPKKGGFYSSAWPTMCEDVTNIVHNELLIRDIPIRCLPHNGSLSVEEEISVMQEATFIIAEHGTISFVPLYANDGTVLLSVGTKNKLKDGQTMLYATHLQVYYNAVEEMHTMGAFIRYGLYRAADNFDISYDFKE